MNAVEELTKQAGLTGTDVVHLHGSDQSPPPSQKKVSLHPLRAGSGAGPGWRRSAVPFRPVRGSAAGSAASAALCQPREGSAAAAAGPGEGLSGHPHRDCDGSTQAGVNILPLNKNRLLKQHPAGRPRPPHSPCKCQSLQRTTPQPGHKTHPVFGPKHLLGTSAPPLVIADCQVSIAEQKQQ